MCGVPCAIYGAISEQLKRAPLRMDRNSLVLLYYDLTSWDYEKK